MILTYPGPESVCPERIGNTGVKLFACQQKRYIFALDAFSAGPNPIRRVKMGRFAMCESVNSADLFDVYTLHIRCIYVVYTEPGARPPHEGNEHPLTVEKGDEGNEHPRRKCSPKPHSRNQDQPTAEMLIRVTISG